jgi:hypothetical protein
VPLKKIQAICNGKFMPIAMQGLARPREKPLAQEQWETMEEQCQEQWKQSDMQEARSYIGVTPDAGDGVAREVPARRPTPFEKQHAPEAAAPDARMSLCTYCHAPLALGTQA